MPIYSTVHSSGGTHSAKIGIHLQNACLCGGTAAFAVIAAWQNLPETGKGSLVRVDEILRHRLIAIEKETDDFNAIASKSVDLTNLYKTLHDLPRTLKLGAVALIPSELT